MKRIAILGAGLSGLSAAYHLRNGYDLFEQGSKVGGLCRTMERKGFLFDYTGHLLHLRQDTSQELINRLLPGSFREHSRKAKIYVRQRWIEYPFQAHIHALPAELVKECILGFITSMPSQSGTGTSLPQSFEHWVLQNFGAGVAKYFMFPYNRKLWQRPLSDLSADWVSWSIPRPSLEEFLNGALGIRNREFGYNANFFYPERGGIQQLPDAFAAALPQHRVHLEHKAVSLDLKQRRLIFEGNESCRFDALISSLPLPCLLDLIQDLPVAVSQARKQLRYISVYDINIGVKRPGVNDAHWIYFPEDVFPFYRVGFPVNFSQHVAPDGCSSMYVEVSTLPEKHLQEQTLLDDVFQGLQRCGILREDDDILVTDVQRIECAYVIHDHQRSSALEVILPFLSEQNIHSIGRYGAWEYNSMEGAILAGKHTAEQIDGILS
ncbi:protoporphyrinogen oxidase [candidate division KSB3 bacterium]|uniref:Protoporphyrinogen oxidase n=1 Tax=candidate division KSB3 bacterium TaxID=2044937 RepID=A0A2G6E435_9BACT|nr:MAG: protoporphyrinogen oxidase [candidate division KSB3 bacterium]PIE29487.1 MAG: protoporphyrinogen oxidase [candidate division KSB3 bacterium]